MREVAELSGVSITTVSHVVNQTRAVAPETRERVFAAIEQTGYTGDAIARSLVTGGTQSLGVAMSLSANPHFAELLTAIETAATEAGYTVLLVDPRDEAEAERTAVHALRGRRVDGLLLTPSADAPVGLLPQLRRLDIPTVLVDRLPEHTGVDQVGPENVQATSALVQHLAELGHRRIALVNGPAKLATSAERALGYRLGLGRGKLVWDPDLVVDGASAAQAGALVNRLLDAPDAPTAVVAGDTTMVIGTLRAIRERGLRVGADIAVVGYDDVPWADLVDPGLTTMAQPTAQIGQTAVRMLLDRIADPAGEPKTVRLAPQLMHRRSCGCH